MLAFADTNWLVASYFDRGESTGQVRRFVERTGNAPLHIGPVQLCECQAVFRRAAGNPDPEELRTLTGPHWGRLVVFHSADWETLNGWALDLLKRFAHLASISWMDAAIIGQAVALNGTTFLSFDAGSSARALAHVLKLQVFPKLSARDTALAADLR